MVCLPTLPESLLLQLRFCVLVAAFSATNIAQIIQEECPHPDKNYDAAVLGHINMTRPPSGISQLNVTSTGAYSIDIAWSDPMFNFNGTVPTPCHFYLNISYTPSQKGSHTRTTHMNLNITMRSASVTKLTPSTLVTLGLSTCLLMPAVGSSKRGFICTEPLEVTEQTAAASDSCSLGFYNSSSMDGCVPCQCNNNSQLCQSVTGKCLDCLFASDGDQCETCLQGYVLSEDGRCVHARLSTSPGYNMELDNGMTSSPTKSARADILSTVKNQPIKTTSALVTPPVTIIVTSVICSLVIICFILIIVYRKCGSCRKKPIQFWTVQLEANNQPTIAYSDITDQHNTREDNKLIENDYMSRFTEHEFVTDENPYRPITA